MIEIVGLKVANMTKFPTQEIQEQIHGGTILWLADEHSYRRRGDPD